jgi:hypothetical protein
MEGLRQIDEPRDLARGVRVPRAAIMVADRWPSAHRPAVEPREAGDDRRAEAAAQFEERALDRPPLSMIGRIL